MEIFYLLLLFFILGSVPAFLGNVYHWYSDRYAAFVLSTGCVGIIGLIVLMVYITIKVLNGS